MNGERRDALTPEESCGAQTEFVPLGEPDAIVRYQVTGITPVNIIVRWLPELNLTWQHRQADRPCNGAMRSSYSFCPLWLITTPLLAISNS